MGSPDSHPLVLNVLLLQPSLRRDGSAGDTSHRSVVDEIHERIATTPNRRARDIALALKTDEDLRAHASEYHPLIYGTWGSYDVAAIYASPTFTPLPQTPRLANLRQVVTGCTLPRASSGFDLNQQFLDELAAQKKEAASGTWLPAPLRFVAVIRVKLAQRSSFVPSGLEKNMTLIAERLLAWRQERPGDRRAAYGATVAWSEVLIVATAAQPADLLRLTFDVRGVATCLRKEVKEVNAHVCLTTHTVLGYDIGVERDVGGRWQTLKQKPTNHTQIIDLATAWGRTHDIEPTQTPEQCWLQMHFAVSPGHETNVVSFVSQDKSFHIGALDVSGPRVPIGKDVGELSPLAAAYYSTLYRFTLSDPTAIRHFAKSITTLSIALDPSGPLEGHVEGDPRKELSPNLLKLVATLNLRQELSGLQVSYAQTEQLMNLLATFRWAWDSYWLWEHAIDLAPSFFALRSHLVGVAEFVREGAQTEVRQVLSELTHHLERLSLAFRNVLITPHWGVSPLNEPVDLNLRFRGSIEQMLGIGQMIASVMTERLIGPRACLSTLGDSSTFSLRVTCGVSVVNLPLILVESPWLFDEVATLVGRRLIEDLYEEAKPEMSWITLYTRRDEVQELDKCLRALTSHAFAGRMHEDFSWSTADFIAMCMLDLRAESWAHDHLLRTLMLTPNVFRDKEKETPGSDVLVLVSAMRRIVYVLSAEAAANEANKSTWSWTDVDGVRTARPQPGDYVEWERLLGQLRQNAQHFLASAVRLPVPREVARYTIERWEAFVEECLTDAEWLRSPQTLYASQRLFRSLRQRAAASLANGGEDVRLNELQALWDATSLALQSVRAVVRPLSKVFVLYRSAANESVRMENAVSKTDERQVQYDSQVLPPEWRELPDARPRATAVLNPRGRFVPVSVADRERLTEVCSSFFSKVLQLLPRHRKVLDSTVGFVEGGRPGG